MRLAGMRFWTWMVVAAIFVFGKSEGGALPQQETRNKKSSSTTRFKHNVPAGSHSKTMLLQDKRKDNNNPTVSSMGKGEQKKWIGQEGGSTTTGSQIVKPLGKEKSTPKSSALTHRRQH
jgi:hypothetical protein